MPLAGYSASRSRRDVCLGPATRSAAHSGLFHRGLAQGGPSIEKCAIVRGVRRKNPLPPRERKGFRYCREVSTRTSPDHVEGLVMGGDDLRHRGPWRGSYAITKHQLDDPYWIDHMADKEWVDIEDFAEAPRIA